MENSSTASMADTPTQRQVVKHSASKAQGTPNDCRLLNLPPELREAIWTLVVTDKGAIDVKATGFARPKLLDTCKQIRSEALKLFYHSNKFTFEIIAYEDNLLLRFVSALNAAGMQPNNTNLGMVTARPSPNWMNMVSWLENVHANRNPLGCAHFKAGTAEWHIIDGLFRMVAASREVEWEREKKAVELMRPALVACDAKWAE